MCGKEATACICKKILKGHFVKKEFTREATIQSYKY